MCQVSESTRKATNSLGDGGIVVINVMGDY